jgi:hypothetical protein
VVKNLIANQRFYNAAELMHQHLKTAGSALIIEVLEGILATQDAGERHGNEAVMLQYYVEHMFEQLDQDSALDEGKLGGLEWAYLNVLENSKRPPRMLARQLSNSAEFFRDMLSLMYRAEGDEPIDPEDPEERERVKNLAHHAYTLFHTWRLLPGQSGERIDARELDQWVDSARALCAAVGSGAVADQRIGELFAYSPSDPDGPWPHASVRSVIECLASDRLETGVYIGIRNKRGVTSRGILDGGDLECESAPRIDPPSYSDSNGLARRSASRPLSDSHIGHRAPGGHMKLSVPDVAQACKRGLTSHFDDVLGAGENLDRCGRNGRGPFGIEAIHVPH